MLSTNTQSAILNLFDRHIPIVDEKFDTLLKHKNISIVRIVSSDTIKTEEYCQQEDEWVVVIEGSATLQIDAKRYRLERGESLFIPAETPHSVLKTENGTIWLAVHIF